MADISALALATALVTPTAGAGTPAAAAPKGDGTPDPFAELLAGLSPGGVAAPALPPPPPAAPVAMSATPAAVAFPAATVGNSPTAEDGSSTHGEADDTGSVATDEAALAAMLALAPEIAPTPTPPQPAHGAADARPAPGGKPARTAPPPATSTPAAAATLPLPPGGTPDQAAGPPAGVADAIRMLLRQQGDASSPPTADQSGIEAPLPPLASRSEPAPAPPPPRRAAQAVLPGSTDISKAAATASGQATARDDAVAAAPGERAEPAIVLQPAAERMPAPSADRANAAAAPTLADAGVEHHLAVAEDGLWLDQLARDIVRSAGTDGGLRFRLDPPNLGRLQVELALGEEGTAVTLTADAEQTHAMLRDAQPRLAAEARAQGLHVSETRVELARADTPPPAPSGSQPQPHGGGTGPGTGGHQSDPRRPEPAPLPVRQPSSATAGDELDGAPARAGGERFA